MAALEIESLTKWYGRTRGVEDVTFAIERGEVFGYLGPNGSGEDDNVIRCLMGLLRPSGGAIRILGERVVPGMARSMRASAICRASSGFGHGCARGVR